jgi:hypothetical protein
MESVRHILPPKSDRTERITLQISAEELRSIDDFRFANRMPNRATAIREILKRSLLLDSRNERAKRRDRKSRGLARHH